MKKLIPAIALLLVSAVLMGTSTFAWFSMNKTVTASSMSITATSNSPYLVISETESGTYDTDAAAMVLAPVADTALKLVTPLNVASNVDYYATLSDRTAGEAEVDAGDPNTHLTTPSKFTNAASVLWGTTSSDNPAQVQASNVTDLVGGTGFSNGTLANYVQTSELWFKILPGNVNGTNLKCTKVTFTDGTNSIAASGRVLLVSETGKYQLFKLVDGDVVAAETGSDSALLAEVTTTAAKITAYFYFDGTDAAAYTNNATDLTAVSAAFTFAID